MRHILVPSLCLLSLATLAQDHPEEGHGLPHTLAPAEVPLIEAYRNSRASERGIEAPPSWVPRTMAEWEEVQSVIVTWTDYESILKQIVRYAKDECEVIIACTDSTDVITYLNGTNGGGPRDPFDPFILNRVVGGRCLPLPDALQQHLG